MGVLAVRLRQIPGTHTRRRRCQAQFSMMYDYERDLRYTPSWPGDLAVVGLASIASESSSFRQMAPLLQNLPHFDECS
jgi:hypothetical protein